MSSQGVEQGQNYPITESRRPLSFLELRKQWIASTPDFETRRSSTIFVVNPQRDDACGELADHLQTARITALPSLPIITGEFSNEEPSVWTPSHLRNMRSAYFVASIRTVSDLFAFTSAVKKVKSQTGAEHITGVFTHLPCTREDREKQTLLEYGQAGPYPALEVENVVMLHEVLDVIQGLVTRGIVVQAHSPEAVERANEIGLPLIPMSPYQHVLAFLKERGVVFDPKSDRVACPDKGEILMDALIRSEIEQIWGESIPRICFDKTRCPNGDVKFRRSSEDDQSLIYEADVWAFDDVASTLQTFGKLSEALSSYGARSVRLVCMYADFVQKWQEYITHPVIKSIYYGNTQVPFGDPKVIERYIKSGKLVPIPLGGFIRQLVEADVCGINPFDHPVLRRAILMTHQDSPSASEQIESYFNCTYQTRMQGF